MDGSNSEFNQILSTPDVRSHESYEDCVSMDAMQPCNALDAGTCFASTNTTTNAHETVCHIGTGDCSRACVSTNNTPNSPETGESLSDSVSISDTPNTPETCNCLADSVPRSDTPNTPETCKCVAGSVPRSDTPNTPETCKCVADSVPRSDTPNTPETCKCVADSVSTEDIVEDIYRIVTKLTESTFNEEELNGNSLMPLNIELRDLQDKGLFTHKLISVINEIVKEKYVKKINWEVYNQMIEALKTFSDIENSAEKNIANVLEMKKNETVKFLTENKHLTKKVFFRFKEIDKGRDNIQQKLAKLKLLNIPGIVETMKTLEELGLLSEVLIYKLVNIGKEVAELAREIRQQRKRMGETINEINGNITKKSIIGNNGEEITVVYINCKNDVSSDTNEREKQLKKADEQSKVRICRSEHNIPLCGNCGWRNSWIKSFKKRGVYIKESAGGSNEHIWVNSINES